MKKALFLWFILIFPIFSYAQNSAKRPIFIEGTAPDIAAQDFFQDNLKMEAISAGYNVTEKKEDAEYTVVFEVVPNMILFDDGTWEYAPPDEKQFVITIQLFRNEDNANVISFNWLFTEIGEMYDYNQFLFLKAAIYIPEKEAGLPEDEILIPGSHYQITDKDGTVKTVAILDLSWKNKWIYFTASVDSPVTYYVLQGKGLVGGVAVYDGKFDSPDSVSSIDHRVAMMPGLSLGVEVQFLNFMSFGLYGKVNTGDTFYNYFINLSAGAELKFPIKFFDSLMIEPYGIFSWNINKSDNFFEFPLFEYGAGMQFCTRAGKNGAYFLDINYMFSLSDTIINNPFGDLYPNPAKIYYKRFVVGISAGYKYGIIGKEAGKKVKEKPEKKVKEKAEKKEK